MFLVLIYWNTIQINEHVQYMNSPGEFLNGCPLIRKSKKAVIPVAGLGTRMLPATKAIPKEMLPLVDKPLIQYVVNECIAAGITEIVLVTHSSKNSIENHFDTSFELEAMLEKTR
ncbi:glucose-1-phosphate uridylyltransferase [Salmonella enterica subsp. enterica]|uniref:UTP--glucose-1-phosphate uridylyltransferase n=1 Tax=Salmonella enterica I TaxID=59201 RepID=A0A3S4ITH7_SALET|nr:glucose-1-phosphate uridylyltransferase [Salmonella enterica subsp. enterica]